jgi:hypothetical protein
MVTRISANEVELRRDELRGAPHCIFLGADEFRSLAISSRRLMRRDDHRAQLRGLIDPETGETFYTEEEKLFA